MMIEEMDEHIRVAGETRKLAGTVGKAAEAVKKVLSAGGKILVCGNGGSAADAQHFAAELVGRYEKERAGLPAIALTTDTSVLTAVGNDFGFAKIFERQVEALGKKGDLLVAISTSGNSENVLLAAKAAKKRGMLIVTLLGKGGGKMKGIGDVEIIVPSGNTARVQEMHCMVLHLICSAVE